MLQDLVSNISYDNDDKYSKLQNNFLTKSDFHIVNLKNKNKNYESNLRIEPKEVNIYDFEVETHYSFSIKISNSAKEMQKLLVKPPKNPYFSFHKNCRKYFQEFELAPGLSIDIKFDLFIPILSNSSVSCSNNFNEQTKNNDAQLFQEEFLIIIDYHYPVHVPIRAFPPEPQLLFTEYIDFGKQMYVPINGKIEKELSYSSNDFENIKKDILLSNKDSPRINYSNKELRTNILSDEESKVNIDSHISNKSNSLQLKPMKFSEEDWKWAIEKKFTIKNIGKLKTRFTISYNENSPLNVFPTSGVLDPVEENEKSF